MENVLSWKKMKKFKEKRERITNIIMVSFQFKFRTAFRNTIAVSAGY